MEKITGKILSRWELTQRLIKAVLEEKLGVEVEVGDDGYIYDLEMTKVLGTISWKMTGENSGTWAFEPES